MLNGQKFGESDALAVASFISDQIWREQELTAHRMSWNLTFQGFMVAAFALIATSDFSAPSRLAMEVMISFAGIAVAVSTLFGVYASQRQRGSLRAHWTSLFGEYDPEKVKRLMPGSAYRSFLLPPPFSARTGSMLGRIAPWVTGLVIVLMWFALGALGYLAKEPEQKVIRLEWVNVIEVPRPPAEQQRGGASGDVQASTSATGT